MTGLYCTLSPALVQPYMRKVTGSDDLAYGHTTSFGVIVGSWVGSLFKDKKNETSEDLKIPDHLAFLKDITVSTAIVMTLLYVICVALAGPTWIQENISNGMDAYLYAISQGVQFGVGITIVLTGVSMMIAEITGAFKGISEKIVPNAIPALDCPVVFNYAPTAVMLGFPELSVHRDRLRGHFRRHRFLRANAPRSSQPSSAAALRVSSVTPGVVGEAQSWPVSWRASCFPSASS